VTPVETLEAAADRLEKLIAGATPGPWEADTSEIYGPTHEWVGETLHTDDPARTDANSAYIAAMNPLVGRAMTLLFREHAEEYRGHGQAASFVAGWGGGGDEDPVLTMARLLLGESLDRVPGEFKTITDKEN